MLFLKEYTLFREISEKPRNPPFSQFASVQKIQPLFTYSIIDCFEPKIRYNVRKMPSVQIKVQYSRSG
jgi:hypothetical protein